MRMKPWNQTLVLAVGGLFFAAACGGTSESGGPGASSGGESPGDGDAAGDGDGSVDGDGDAGSGGSGDGDGANSGGAPNTGGDSPNTGGDSPMGGATSSGGEGTGGSNDVVTTATLGDSCASPGAFSCAVSNEKLALLCDGSGEWVARETCSGESTCDPNEGADLGTCRERLPECDLYSGSFCDAEGNAVECSPSGFETILLDACGDGYACRNGECHMADDPCPDGGLHNCSDDDCGPKRTWCAETNSCENSHWATYVFEGAPTLVRIPNEGLCSVSGCDRKRYGMIIPSDNLPEMAMRFEVGPGWGLAYYLDGEGEFCGDLVEGCLVVPPKPNGATNRGVYLIPLSDNPVIRNVSVEPVPPGTTCD